MKKTPVYLWLNQAHVIDFEPMHSKHTDATQHRIVDDRLMTNAENAANALSIMPNCDVEALLDIIVQSVKYSNELGETDSQMKSRIYADIMTTTTDHKRQFSS